ncbi:MAG TPA: PilZ domain-containing protein [Polyangiaceae bacterium]|nr:PilZ domain-containing protein [Polyangiaceae bacterium]
MVGATEPRLSLDQTPRLRALVEGPEGDEILAELHKLVRREPARATRYERNLFARIRAEPDAPPEIAVVRDLSRSGVRLELSSSAHLDVMNARTVAIEMRLPGSPFVSCEATLVRVGEHLANGVELAFSFTQSSQDDPAFAALLERLATAQAAAR